MSKSKRWCIECDMLSCNCHCNARERIAELERKLSRAVELGEKLYEWTETVGNRNPYSPGLWVIELKELNSKS